MGLIIPALTISQGSDETSGRRGCIWNIQLYSKARYGWGLSYNATQASPTSLYHKVINSSILTIRKTFLKLCMFSPQVISWDSLCIEVGLPFICPETSSFKPGDAPWVQSFGICEQTCFHSACTLHDCVSFPSSSLQVGFCSMRPNTFRLCSHKVPSIPVITVGSLWTPCPLAFPHVSATVLSSLTIGPKYHLSNISAQCLPESCVLVNT